MAAMYGAMGQVPNCWGLVSRWAVPGHHEVTVYESEVGPGLFAVREESTPDARLAVQSACIEHPAFQDVAEVWFSVDGGRRACAVLYATLADAKLDWYRGHGGCLYSKDARGRIVVRPMRAIPPCRAEPHAAHYGCSGRILSGGG